MKKVLALVLTLVMVLSLTACGKSQAEKEYEEEVEAASGLKKTYERLQESNDKIQKDFDDYNSALSRLENAN